VVVFTSWVSVSSPVESGTTEQEYPEVLALAVLLVTLQYLLVSITFEWRFDQWSDAVRLTLRKVVVVSGGLTGLGAVLFVNPPVTERVGGAGLYGTAAICASFLAAFVVSLRYPVETTAQDAPTPSSESVEQRETVVTKPENDDSETFAGTAFEPLVSPAEESSGEDASVSEGDDAEE